MGLSSSQIKKIPTMKAFLILSKNLQALFSPTLKNFAGKKFIKLPKKIFFIIQNDCRSMDQIQKSLIL